MKTVSGLGSPETHDNERRPADSTPQFEIEEREDLFVVRAGLPGPPPECIVIRFEDGVLSIHGEQAGIETVAARTAGDGPRRHVRFHRRVSLARSARSGSTIQGQATDSPDPGLLEIIIPKTTRT